MRTNIVALPARLRLREVGLFLESEQHNARRLLPVVDEHDVLQGLIARSELSGTSGDKSAKDDVQVREIAKPVTAEVYSDEPLRVAVYRMAEKGVTRMPVVERETLGMFSLEDLLKARTKHLEEERRREQSFRWRPFIPGKGSPNVAADAV